METTTVFDVEAFVVGYMECAAWLTTFDGDVEEDWSEHLDGQDIDERNGERVANEILRLCDSALIVGLLDTPKRFVADNMAEVVQACSIDGYDAGKAGHDLYLTQNGHGAGFWDRGLGEVGDQLTKMAHLEGSCSIVGWLGDDGGWCFEVCN